MQNMDNIAIRILHAWMLTVDLAPIGGFDPQDPNCRREYGPHIVWTLAASVPQRFINAPVLADLSHSLEDFLAFQNAALGTRFEVYDIGAYDSHIGNHVYVSITAI